MRPLRLVILLSCFIVLPLILTIFSLIPAYSGRSSTASDDLSPQPGGGLRAFFSFGSPSSLFPPSAIISLTDDNTTFFVARPAAFGPLLPARGLSGSLWVGSGFGEDVAKKGGIVTGAEGELGCSDVPGWVEVAVEPDVDMAGKQAVNSKANKKSSGRIPRKNDGIKGGSSPNLSSGTVDKKVVSKSKDDGTDDYLTDSVRKSHPAAHVATTKAKQPEHADIQSLQESAEIAGKVVLLSRGGCGFLDKVKWAQRRGAIALIVGDDTRGGGLVTMYARGDTSNISIPSIFTSHTTAHLLSSLIPPDHGPRSRPSPKSKSKDQAKEVKNKDKPIFTTTRGLFKTTATPRPTVHPAPEKLPQSGDSSSEPSLSVKEPKGFLQSLFTFLGLQDNANGRSRDKHRPPSSGQLEWTVVDDFEEDNLDPPKRTSMKTDKVPLREIEKAKSGQAQDEDYVGNSDDFVIGVHDWRDPDLVGAMPLKETGTRSATKPGQAQSTLLPKGQSDIESQKKKKKGPHSSLVEQKEKFKGGSITPGSGEYLSKDQEKHSKDEVKDPSAKLPAKGSVHDEMGSGWFDSLPWLGKAPTSDSPLKGKLHTSDPSLGDTWEEEQLDYEGEMSQEEHEGLWVTLTPTSMSSSPFFDTLLVLVVSPLVTLTVVYALLLLRSRIRRRRWRAPKSVVERLPVRTYHAVSTPMSTHTRSNTPPNMSPSSPLLTSASSRSPSASQLRPRSRTTSGIPSLLRDADLPPSRSRRSSADLSDDEEKGHSKWRRPYSGKQVECVVCLEEYVDGVSKVMSLPCGHEFHVDCITPWLTTRRRTCPICKGDVVRSLTSNKRRNGGRRSNSPSAAPVTDEDDIQAQAVRTANTSPLADLPIGPADSDNEVDLEPSSEQHESSLRERVHRFGELGLRRIRALSAAAFGGDEGRGRVDRERERLIGEEQDERERNR